MTVKEFLIKAKATSSDYSEAIKSLNRPKYVCGVLTPESLSDITFGELVMLQSIVTDDDFIFKPSEIILKLSRDALMSAEAIDVIGFSMFVSSEVSKINSLFRKTEVKPTKEEIKAGAESLNFGVFGIIDYYALRMGITNHEEVESVPWIRIYKCLDIDSQKNRFQRRLQKIYAEK